MSLITVDLPPPLQTRLEAIAREYGVSVQDLLVQAAHLMAQVEELELLRGEAMRRDTRAGFERVLAAAPDVPPIHPEDVIR